MIYEDDGGGGDDEDGGREDGDEDGDDGGHIHPQQGQEIMICDKDGEDGNDHDIIQVY